jgi:acyl-CoA thioesterase I
MVNQRRRWVRLLGAWGMVAAMAQAAAPTAPTGTSKTVLILGDSLSAEYGLARGTGWVALLSARLATYQMESKPDKKPDDKRDYAVVNASISGDTTSGGRSRLPGLLAQHKPAVVVIELGGNDALRGLPLKMTEDNLASLVRASQAAGAQVLLLGMQIPPNYGADYAKQFAQVYVTVAQAHKAAVVPFFLAGIADDPDPSKWFQADRIHPLASAHPKMLDNVWPSLKKLLK